MAVEVDQSGRVEDLSTGTALAFSNDESGALYISAGVKRRLIVYLRESRLIPAKEVPVVLFTILLFLLIEKRALGVLNIDEEYTGKNGVIEETLKKLFARGEKRIPDVRFIRIGKRSAAHQLAWRSHRSKGRGSGVKKISESDVAGFLQEEQ